jgi:hypothetical protein
LAFARRNFERRTDDDAVVHRCVLYRSELDEGRRTWSRITMPTNAPTSVATRPRGDKLAYVADSSPKFLGGRAMVK